MSQHCMYPHSEKAHLIHQPPRESFLHLADPLLHFTHHLFTCLRLNYSTPHFGVKELGLGQWVDL
jgi:hypothetical protein